MTNINRADVEAEIDFLRTAAEQEENEADYFRARAVDLRLEANRLEKELDQSN